jgi:pyrroline-5-carboxylate reductase
MSKPLSSCRLAFIGGGNMASAIIGGLLSKGLGKDNIIVSAPSSGTREALEAKGTSVTPSNVEAARGADVIILAVKPAVASSVCEELRSAWSQLGDGNSVVVSVAAGVTAGSLRGWLGGNDGVAIPIVRVMPNTPSLVGEGASGAFADENVKEHQKQLVDSILSSICKVTEWVEKEELLDVVTAISGNVHQSRRPGWRRST